MPTGGGKSRVVAMALEMVISKKVRTEKVKIGWIAPTIEAREQGLFAMNQIPLVADQDILCVCAASGISMADRDIVIVDECKHSCSETWFEMVSKCPNRWGLDASPFSDDAEKNSKISDLFGNNILVIRRSEMGDAITSAKVIVLNDSDGELQSKIDEDWKLRFNKRKRFLRRQVTRCYRISGSWRKTINFWKGMKWKIEAQCKWIACMEFGIAENVARNDAVIREALRHSEDHVLILVNSIEHGEKLQERISGSKLCFSKMGKKDRRETISKFKSGEIGCVICTSLADEALDVPIADVLILVSGGRSEQKAVQRTGRVLRRFEGKEIATIIDFADNYHPMAANHFKKRLLIYRKLGYTIL